MPQVHPAKAGEVMWKSKRLRACFCGLAALTGTASGQTVSVPALGPGWQCLLSPDDFNQPGTIVEVASDKQVYLLKDLSKQIKVIRGRAADLKFTETKELSGGIVVGLLARVLPGVKGSVGAEANSRGRNSVVYERLEKEVTDGEADKVAARWARENHDRFENSSRGSRYFLIREAILAGQISYDLSSQAAASIGGEAQLKKVGNLKITAGGGTGQQLRLEQQFAPPIRVCLKSRELGVVGAGSGGEQVFGLLKGDGEIPILTP